MTTYRRVAFAAFLCPGEVDRAGSPGRWLNNGLPKPGKLTNRQEGSRYSAMRSEASRKDTVVDVPRGIGQAEIAA